MRSGQNNIRGATLVRDYSRAYRGTNIPPQLTYAPRHGILGATPLTMPSTNHLAIAFPARLSASRALCTAR